MLSCAVLCPVKKIFIPMRRSATSPPPSDLPSSPSQRRRTSSTTHSSQSPFSPTSDDHELAILYAGLSLSSDITPDSLNERQRDAVNWAREQSNLFITGSAGVGKSRTVNAIVADLHRQHRSVALAAPTGAAAVNIGGVTIHNFFGIRIPHKLSDFNQMWKKKTSIRMTDVLIIDEVSMVSGMMTDALEFMVAMIRCEDLIGDRLTITTNVETGQTKRSLTTDALRSRWEAGRPYGSGFGDIPPWGGMQVVFVGDFFQLPPINAIDRQPYDERSHGNRSDMKFRGWGYAFESFAWRHTNIKIVELTEVYRQATDGHLINFLCEVRIGNVNRDSHRETIDCLTRNGGQLPVRGDGIRPTVLFGKNDDADKKNEEELGLLQSDMHISYAKDTVKLAPARLNKCLKQHGLDQPPMVTGIGEDGTPVGFTALWSDIAGPKSRLISYIEDLEIEKELSVEARDYKAAGLIDQKLDLLKPQLETVGLVTQEKLESYLSSTMPSGSTSITLSIHRLLLQIHDFQRQLQQDREILQKHAKEFFFDQKKCRVPNKLVLKQDCQVMLLINEDLESGLANGSRGVVVDMVDHDEYCNAMNEEAQIRGKVLTAFDREKKLLDNERLRKIDEIRRSGASTSGVRSPFAEATASYNLSMTLLRERFREEKDSAESPPLLRVSAEVSASIKSMSIESFQKEQERMSNLSLPGMVLVEMKFPLVRFNNGEVRVLSFRTFRKEWPKSGVASREQIPVRLAWAMSIHKSQGMTISWLEIDLTGMFAPGQSYVALSRGRSAQEMAVKNLSISEIQTSETVKEYYQRVVVHGMVSGGSAGGVSSGGGSSGGGSSGGGDDDDYQWKDWYMDYLRFSEREEIANTKVKSLKCCHCGKQLIAKLSAKKQKFYAACHANKECKSKEKKRGWREWLE